MPRIIKNEHVVDDDWVHLEANPDDGNAAPEALPDGPVFVPLSVWRHHAAALRRHPHPVGVWLDSHEDPAAVADQLDELPAIALRFPKFTDGRAYSSARLLRERHAYRGELRAIGDVLHDQLSLMKRCGFDAFAVRADKDIDAALSGLRTFSESYQAAVDQPLPLFRRRTG